MKFMKTMLTAILLISTGALADAPEGGRIKVMILMFDGVQVIDFAAPYEVFGQAGFDVRTVSRDGKAVKTAMNLSVNVDHGFDDAAHADVVVVPGGNVHDAAKDEATLAWIRKHAAGAKQVLSICTGSDILAGTGLLDGQSATTFHQNFDAMEQAFPDVRIVRDQRWVAAGKLVTSAGLASGMDAALHVVANLRGVKAARSVAMHLEYDWSPQAGFVRGLMADQFMRMPSPPLQLPEGTRFERVTSVGDSRYWEIEQLVTSPLAPAELLEHVRKIAKQDKALQVLPLPDPMQLAWQYESPRGGHWRLSFQANAKQADGRFRLVAKVMRLY